MSQRPVVLEPTDDENSSSRIPLNQCKKVFIQRDYLHGLTVRFHTAMPQELVGRIEPDTWLKTIGTLNDLYGEAEKIGARSALETLAGCFSCYLSHLCITGQYTKNLRIISEYLDQQNAQVYIPRGLYITDPIERGLRVIEVSLLTERASPRQQPGVTPSATIVHAPAS